ncbi:hypothetical protein WI36_20085 [Burkholderia ubonensis]|uniref:PRTRC system protein F n=1 Tax=Burkholderia ubonensis TaxID=101571 RepID=UPI0007581C0A|nr:PRTRC system protein F [Burkholderia ubonensis]KUZ70794.1 hypothetical protein WI36_20085 [Burkholderia ubonensis]
MTTTPMILPRIAADVPARYVAGESHQFIRRLSLALLNGNVITKDDAAALGPDIDARQIATGSIVRTWRNVTTDLRWFDWNLRISGDQRQAHSVLATIHSTNGVGSAPVRFIGPAVHRLERAARGLGQTVLAVLYEVCEYYLPAICTPSETLGLAQFMYWNGEIDECAIMAELADMNGIKEPENRTPDALAAFFEECDTPRRAEFFRNAPDWACSPQRVLSDEQIEIARRSTNDVLFVDAVIHACSEIHRIVTTGGPFARIDCRDASEHGIDYAMYLLWDDQDGTGRVLDDFWNHEMQGDPLEASTAVQLSLTKKDLGNWFYRMRNTATLAAATEDLLAYISTSDYQADEHQSIRVRV